MRKKAIAIETIPIFVNIILTIVLITLTSNPVFVWIARILVVASVLSFVFAIIGKKIDSEDETAKLLRIADYIMSFYMPALWVLLFVAYK